MRAFQTYLYEGRHLLRSPFKLVALFLFTAAALYGLHLGSALFHRQHAEIERILVDTQEERQTYLAYYEEGKQGPEDRPWVNFNTPFWAVWYSYVHHFKQPSPAMVYSIGQAEQYGYYKRVSFWASPLDSDMTQEIANPERLQSNSLDYSFVILFLQPVLLLILLYNLKSSEAEQGLLPLIEVQAGSKGWWLGSRVLFYTTLLIALNIGLLLYGAVLTGVFAQAALAFWSILLHSILYLSLWTALFYLILRIGKTVLANTLMMAGLWLLFAFIIPAGVYQGLSILKPANLMTEFIDATRDDRNEMFDQPDSILQQQLFALFPAIAESPVAKDSLEINRARNQSASALANELAKASIEGIEKESKDKNEMIQRSFWFNPVILFQNRFNSISETHYDDYEKYRGEIHALIDKQIRVMVHDNWNAVEVDKEKFQEYVEELSSL